MPTYHALHPCTFYDKNDENTCWVFHHMNVWFCIFANLIFFRVFAMFFRFEGSIRPYHDETTWSCEGIHDARHQHFRHSHKGELLPFDPSSNIHIGSVTLSLLPPSCCLHDTSRERRSDIGDWLYGPLN